MKLCFFFLGISALPFSKADESHGSIAMPSSDAGLQSSAQISGDSMDSMMEPSPMSMEHHHGRPILEYQHLEPQQRKYWEQYNTTTFFNAEDGNKSLLWMHATLLVAAIGFLGPVTLVSSTSLEAQWLYIPLQTVQSATFVASLFFLALYAGTAPDLYPGSAYSGFAGAMFALVLIHWMLMMTKSISSFLDVKEYTGLATSDYHDSSNPPSQDRHENPHASAPDDLNEHLRDPSLSSTDFGSGGETDISSIDAERDFRKMSHSLAQYQSPTRPVPFLVRKLARYQFFVKANSFIGQLSTVLFHLLNYPLFFTEWGFLLTGLSTAFLMGKGHNVFALLAHFIKGFIFFALGMCELARFFGVGSSRGWAWNESRSKFSRRSANRNLFSRIRSMLWPDHPTFEFIQSFLIFFYGATNVFLEHLGNNDGVWSHKDLQHASIAFMFFGGGLCGMILESVTIKCLIGKAFHLQKYNDRPANEVRRTWSFNPMPAFIIFWTGALMSHHQQETELSTQIHIQWGNMFSLAAVIRLCTIALLYTKPVPTSDKAAQRPQRPFTEVLVSFCLVCGGLIFMSSNRETVEGMIYRGIDQMFTLNISVGITVLLMAYFICALAIRGFAVSRYSA